MNGPLNIPPADDARARAPLEANLTHRILVVEDDSAVRRLNTEVLIRSGYEVEAAEDGEAAWEALMGDTYDLMITDNGMPRMTGIELLKKLRAARLELPVIMATGVLPAEEFARSPWLLPEATLVKPYTIGELLMAVKKVLLATGIPREEILPAPNPQNQTSTDDSRP